MLRSSLQYRFPTLTVQINDPGHEEVLTGTTVFVFNLPRYALGLPFAPTARGDDGLLDLVVFRNAGPFQALYYLWLVVRSLHLDTPSVFHRRVRGWHDIGYNFALDRFGRLFEARAGGIDEAVTGAHAGGYNGCSTGVAVLGTYSSRPISLAARARLEQLLSWKLSLHGVGVLGRVLVTVDPAGAAYSRYPAGSEVSLPRIQLADALV